VRCEAGSRFFDMEQFGENYAFYPLKMIIFVA